MTHWYGKISKARVGLWLERYRFQASIHIAKDVIRLMGSYADGEGSAIASGKVDFCNNTLKSINSPCNSDFQPTNFLQ